MGNITITMLTKNRLWSLPSVLGALLALEYPKDQLSVVFVDDSSTDGTFEFLKDWRDRHRSRYAHIRIIRDKNPVDDAFSARDTTDRKNGYVHLADLRNQAIDAALEFDFDHLFSVDSDILVSPTIMSQLLNHGKEYVATMIFNDIAQPYGTGRILDGGLTGRATNAGGLYGNTWQVMRRYSLDRLYLCGYSGAVFIVNRAVIDSGVRFGVNPVSAQACEDYGFCWMMQERGIPRHVWTGLLAIHMQLGKGCDPTPVLTEGAQLYAEWFGTPLIPFVGKVAA